LHDQEIPAETLGSKTASIQGFVFYSESCEQQPPFALGLMLFIER
jgi:hypothetical protein